VRVKDDGRDKLKEDMVAVCSLGLCDGVRVCDCVRMRVRVISE